MLGVVVPDFLAALGVSTETQPSDPLPSRAAGTTTGENGMVAFTDALAALVEPAGAGAVDVAVPAPAPDEPHQAGPPPSQLPPAVLAIDLVSPRAPAAPVPRVERSDAGEDIDDEEPPATADASPPVLWVPVDQPAPPPRVAEPPVELIRAEPIADPVEVAGPPRPDPAVSPHASHRAPVPPPQLPTPVAPISTAPIPAPPAPESLPPTLPGPAAEREDGLAKVTPRTAAAPPVPIADAPRSIDAPPSGAGPFLGDSPQKDPPRAALPRREGALFLQALSKVDGAPAAAPHVATQGAPVPPAPAPLRDLAPAPAPVVLTGSDVPELAALAAQGHENLERLVQAFRVTGGGDRWSAVVQIRPEHLGPVTVAVRVDGNMVRATVTADGAPVREWLEAQRDDVRLRLAERGFELERFEVRRDGEDAPRRDRDEEPAPRRPPRRRGEDDAPVFDVSV